MLRKSENVKKLWRWRENKKVLVRDWRCKNEGLNPRWRITEQAKEEGRGRKRTEISFTDDYSTGIHSDDELPWIEFLFLFFCFFS